MDREIWHPRSSLVRTDLNVENQITFIKFKKFSTMTMRWLFIPLFCLLALACSREMPAFHATDLTGATFGRQLALPDHNGQPRSLSDFQGKAVVVFFGYTSCPDICPGTLARFAEVMKRLGKEAERVQVLFVTLDPERDTADRMKTFVPWFHPSFIGLRGDIEQTRATASEFRIFSARKEVGGAMGYVLDHSAGAYIYDPAGRLRLYVKDDATVEDIVADLRQLLAG